MAETRSDGWNDFKLLRGVHLDLFNSIPLDLPFLLRVLLTILLKCSLPFQSESSAVA